MEQADDERDGEEAAEEEDVDIYEDFDDAPTVKETKAKDGEDTTKERSYDDGDFDYALTLDSAMEKDVVDASKKDDGDIYKDLDYAYAVASAQEMGEKDVTMEENVDIYEDLECTPAVEAPKGKDDGNATKEGDADFSEHFDFALTAEPAEHDPGGLSLSELRSNYEKVRAEKARLQAEVATLRTKEAEDSRKLKLVTKHLSVLLMTAQKEIATHTSNNKRLKEQNSQLRMKITSQSQSQPSTQGNPQPKPLQGLSWIPPWLRDRHQGTKPQQPATQASCTETSRPGVEDRRHTQDYRSRSLEGDATQASYRETGRPGVEDRHHPQDYRSRSLEDDATQASYTETGRPGMDDRRHTQDYRSRSLEDDATQASYTETGRPGMDDRRHTQDYRSRSLEDDATQASYTETGRPGMDDRRHTQDYRSRSLEGDALSSTPPGRQTRSHSRESQRSTGSLTMSTQRRSYEKSPYAWHTEPDSTVGMPLRNKGTPHGSRSSQHGSDPRFGRHPSESRRSSRHDSSMEIRERLSPYDDSFGSEYAAEGYVSEQRAHHPAKDSVSGLDPRLKRHHPSSSRHFDSHDRYLEIPDRTLEGSRVREHFREGCTPERQLHYPEEDFPVKNRNRRKDFSEHDVRPDVYPSEHSFQRQEKIHSSKGKMKEKTHPSKGKIDGKTHPSKGQSKDSQSKISSHRSRGKVHDSVGGSRESSKHGEPRRSGPKDLSMEESPHRSRDQRLPIDPDRRHSRERLSSWEASERLPRRREGSLEAGELEPDREWDMYHDSLERERHYRERREKMDLQTDRKGRTFKESERKRQNKELEGIDKHRSSLEPGELEPDREWDMYHDSLERQKHYRERRETMDLQTDRKGRTFKESERKRQNKELEGIDKHRSSLEPGELEPDREWDMYYDSLERQRLHQEKREKMDLQTDRKGRGLKESVRKRQDKEVEGTDKHRSKSKSRVSGAESRRGDDLSDKKQKLESRGGDREQESGENLDSEQQSHRPARDLRDKLRAKGKRTENTEVTPERTRHKDPVKDRGAKVVTQKPDDQTSRHQVGAAEAAMDSGTLCAKQPADSDSRRYSQKQDRAASLTESDMTDRDSGTKVAAGTGDTDRKTSTKSAAPRNDTEQAMETDQSPKPHLEPPEDEFSLDKFLEVGDLGGSGEFVPAILCYSSNDYLGPENTGSNMEMTHGEDGKNGEREGMTENHGTEGEASQCPDTGITPVVEDMHAPCDSQPEQHGLSEATISTDGTESKAPVEETLMSDIQGLSAVAETEAPESMQWSAAPDLAADLPAADAGEILKFCDLPEVETVEWWREPLVSEETAARSPAALSQDTAHGLGPVVARESAGPAEQVAVGEVVSHEATSQQLQQDLEMNPKCEKAEGEDGHGVLQCNVTPSPAHTFLEIQTSSPKVSGDVIEKEDNQIVDHSFAQTLSETWTSSPSVAVNETEKHLNQIMDQSSMHTLSNISTSSPSVAVDEMEKHLNPMIDQSSAQTLSQIHTSPPSVEVDETGIQLYPAVDQSSAQTFSKAWISSPSIAEDETEKQLNLTCNQPSTEMLFETWTFSPSAAVQEDPEKLGPLLQPSPEVIQGEPAHVLAASPQPETPLPSAASSEIPAVEGQSPERAGLGQEVEHLAPTVDAEPVQPSDTPVAEQPSVPHTSPGTGGSGREKEMDSGREREMDSGREFSSEDLSQEPVPDDSADFFPDTLSSSESSDARPTHPLTVTDTAELGKSSESRPTYPPTVVDAAELGTPSCTRQTSPPTVADAAETKTPSNASPTSPPTVADAAQLGISSERRPTYQSTAVHAAELGMSSAVQPSVSHTSPDTGGSGREMEMDSGRERKMDSGREMEMDSGRDLSSEDMSQEPVPNDSDDFFPDTLSSSESSENRPSHPPTAVDTAESGTPSYTRQTCPPTVADAAQLGISSERRPTYQSTAVHTAELGVSSAVPHSSPSTGGSGREKETDSGRDLSSDDLSQEPVPGDSADYFPDTLSSSELETLLDTRPTSPPTLTEAAEVGTPSDAWSSFPPTVADDAQLGASSEKGPTYPPTVVDAAEVGTPSYTKQTSPPTAVDASLVEEDRPGDRWMQGDVNSPGQVEPKASPQEEIDWRAAVEFYGKEVPLLTPLHTDSGSSTRQTESEMESVAGNSTSSPSTRQDPRSAQNRHVPSHAVSGQVLVDNQQQVKISPKAVSGSVQHDFGYKETSVLDVMPEFSEAEGEQDNAQSGEEPVVSESEGKNSTSEQIDDLEFDQSTPKYPVHEKNQSREVVPGYSHFEKLSPGHKQKPAGGEDLSFVSGATFGSEGPYMSQLLEDLEISSDEEQKEWKGSTVENKQPSPKKDLAHSEVRTSTPQTSSSPCTDESDQYVEASESDSLHHGRSLDKSHGRSAAARETALPHRRYSDKTGGSVEAASEMVLPNRRSSDKSDSSSSVNMTVFEEQLPGGLFSSTPKKKKKGNHRTGAFGRPDRKDLSIEARLSGASMGSSQASMDSNRTGSFDPLDRTVSSRTDSSPEAGGRVGSARGRGEGVREQDSTEAGMSETWDDTSIMPGWATDRKEVQQLEPRSDGSQLDQLESYLFDEGQEFVGVGLEEGSECSEEGFEGEDKAVGESWKGDEWAQDNEGGDGGEGEAEEEIESSYIEEEGEEVEHGDPGRVDGATVTEEPKKTVTFMRTPPSEDVEDAEQADAGRLDTSESLVSGQESLTSSSEKSRTGSSSSSSIRSNVENSPPKVAKGRTILCDTESSSSSLTLPSPMKRKRMVMFSPLKRGETFEEKIQLRLSLIETNSETSAPPPKKTKLTSKKTSSKRGSEGSHDSEEMSSRSKARFSSSSRKDPPSFSSSSRKDPPSLKKKLAEVAVSRPLHSDQKQTVKETRNPRKSSGHPQFTTAEKPPPPPENMRRDQARTMITSVSGTTCDDDDDDDDDTSMEEGEIVSDEEEDDYTVETSESEAMMRTPTPGKTTTVWSVVPSQQEDCQSKRRAQKMSEEFIHVERQLPQQSPMEEKLRELSRSARERPKNRQHVRPRGVPDWPQRSSWQEHERRDRGQVRGDERGHPFDSYPNVPAARHRGPRRGRRPLTKNERRRAARIRRQMQNAQKVPYGTVQEPVHKVFGYGLSNIPAHTHPAMGAGCEAPLQKAPEDRGCAQDRQDRHRDPAALGGWRNSSHIELGHPRPGSSQPGPSDRGGVPVLSRSFSSPGVHPESSWNARDRDPRSSRWQHPDLGQQSGSFRGGKRPRNYSQSDPHGKRRHSEDIH